MRCGCRTVRRRSPDIRRLLVQREMPWVSGVQFRSLTTVARVRVVGGTPLTRRALRTRPGVEGAGSRPVLTSTVRS